MKFLLILIGFLPAIIFADAKKDHVGASVVHVQDDLLNCDCKIPAHVGKVCIRPTKWKNLDASKYYPDEYFTRFEAKVDEGLKSISESNFTLTSTAYYYRCVNEPLSVDLHYVNSSYVKNYVKQDFYTDKYYQNIGLKGVAPRMRVALLENLNSPIKYDLEVAGQFGEEKTVFIEGGFQEYYRLSYPGKVSYTTSLKKLLSKEEVKIILAEGIVYTRYVKSWLSIHTYLARPKPIVDFGVFTLRLRFYRKSEIANSERSTSNPELLNLSNIGVEVIE